MLSPKCRLLCEVTTQSEDHTCFPFRRQWMGIGSPVAKLSMAVQNTENGVVLGG